MSKNFNLKEVAEILDISVEGVRKLIKRGILKANVVKKNKYFRYEINEEEILRLMTNEGK